MSKSGLWVIAAVAVITLLSLVYMALTYEAPQGTTTVVLPSPTQQQEPDPQPREAEPASNSLPSIRIEPERPAPAVASEPEIAPPPVEVQPTAPEPAEPAEALVQLPSLNNSDGFVLEQVSALQNGMRLTQLMTDQQLIRRFVVLVENVSRGSLPQTELPYRGMSGEMPVDTLDENLFAMDDAAFARFDQVIDTFVSVDTGAAIGLYRMLSPLFQQAYAEIGYRDVSFDETLKTAIQTVLQTSNRDGPIQLVKPSVMYLYADATLENLNAVEKQLIRLGPDNSAKLKTKLRQFAERL